MATWIDAALLILTITFFGGIIWGVLYAINAASKAMTSTRKTLESKGVKITENGVSVQTSKRFDREDYVDATQRGFIKVMGASSFGPGDSPSSDKRKDASSSPIEAPKRGVFTRRKTHNT